MRAHEIIPLLLTAIPAALLLTLLTRDRAGHLERELRSVPLRKLAELRTGLFRSVGRARGIGPALRAPISGRPCLAWRLVVQRPRHGTRWSTTVDMSACTEFWLEDEGGRAAVSPGGRFVLALDGLHTAVRGQWRQLPVEVAAVLDVLHRSRDVRTAVWDPAGGAWFRFTELRLEVDQILCIGGEIHEEPHPLGEIVAAREVPMRRVFRGTAENPLIVVGGGG